MRVLSTIVIPFDFQEGGAGGMEAWRAGDLARHLRVGGLEEWRGGRRVGTELHRGSMIVGA